jgi:hypothetical protein
LVLGFAVSGLYGRINRQCRNRTIAWIDENHDLTTRAVGHIPGRSAVVDRPVNKLKAVGPPASISKAGGFIRVLIIWAGSGRSLSGVAAFFDYPSA